MPTWKSHTNRSLRPAVATGIRSDNDTQQLSLEWHVAPRKGDRKTLHMIDVYMLIVIAQEYDGVSKLTWQLELDKRKGMGEHTEEVLCMAGLNVAYDIKECKRPAMIVINIAC